MIGCTLLLVIFVQNCIMALLIKNIKKLVQVEQSPVKLVSGKDMATVQTIEDAFLFVEDGKIAAFGEMNRLSDSNYFWDGKEVDVIDVTGRMVFPSFVDSHTHLVYPASREIEYIDKIKGLSYEEIAKRGGGILNSAKKMQEISEEELLQNALRRLDEIIDFGTGAVEIKSGYGLSFNAELKMLRVIKKLKQMTPLTIKSTFLGAHAVPLEYRGNNRSMLIW